MFVECNHLNLKEIAESGQCFRFKELLDDTFSVVIGDKNYILKQEEKGISGSFTKEEWENDLSHYFDFETDYDYIENLILNSKDSHLIKAYNQGSGIRILNQDLWEIIISFLISQNNNIKRIKNSIEALCTAAGYKCTDSDSEYRFPKACEFDSENFMRLNLGLGYRNIYLKEMFEYVGTNPLWTDYLKTLDYEEARKELLKHKGIGPKVADCICLFGLHHIEAFPIDTHVRQLLDKYYKSGFNYEYFKGCAGVIQQYLFYYELKTPAS